MAEEIGTIDVNDFASFGNYVGVPPEILIRMAQKETSYNPSTGTFRNVCNSTGACGLMQIRPVAMKEFERTSGLQADAYDRLNPYDSLFIAAWLMTIERSRFKALAKRTGKNELGADWTYPVAAYNFGYGNVVDWINGKKSLPIETKNYVAAITGASVS